MDLTQTGAQVMRVTHSTATAKSSSSSSSKNLSDASRFLPLYGGVTHVQCFPPQSPCPCSPLSDPPSTGNSHAPAFASACSLGVVKVWRLIPTFYSSLGTSSGTGTNDGEGALDDDPVLGEQATIQVATVMLPSTTPLYIFNFTPLIADRIAF